MYFCTVLYIQYCTEYAFYSTVTGISTFFVVSVPVYVAGSTPGPAAGGATDDEAAPTRRRNMHITTMACIVKAKYISDIT